MDVSIVIPTKNGGHLFEKSAGCRFQNRRQSMNMK